MPSPPSFTALVVRGKAALAGSRQPYRIALNVTPVVDGVDRPPLPVELDTRSDPALLLDRESAEGIGLALDPADRRGGLLTGVGGQTADGWVREIGLRFGGVPHTFPVTVYGLDVPPGTRRRLLGLTAVHPDFDVHKAGDLVTFTLTPAAAARLAAPPG